jgi:hypothetical protein
MRRMESKELSTSGLRIERLKDFFPYVLRITSYVLSQENRNGRNSWHWHVPRPLHDERA